MKELVTLEEAAQAVNKTTHNIRDYIQRGRIAKYNPDGEVIARAKNGELRVDLVELRLFLHLVNQQNEVHHHAGLNAELGFYDVPERERTKHVHRLHPYLGKFIPQLAEWFLRHYFSANDWVLDPFMGSGTTLIQANELGLNTIGTDISEFCCRIVQVKTHQYDLPKVHQEILEAERRTQVFSSRLQHPQGVPTQLPLFDDEFESFRAQLLSECDSDYLKTWFAPNALLEILYYKRLIEQAGFEYPDLLRVLLSRAVRSSRLVPHYDLATPKAPLPVGIEYDCRKHRRMCLPIDNAISKIHAYSEDTYRRLATFDQLRKPTEIHVLHGDARTVDLTPALQGRQLAGIFTSPPYVGQIDYHDQHIYAYELFGIPRNDTLEIGPKAKGKSKKAQQDYVEGISAVLRNIAPFVKPDGKFLMVANDRFGLYPEIAQRAGLQIVETHQRAVTKRTEQGDDPYQETIFHMQKADHS